MKLKELDYFDKSSIKSVSTVLSNDELSHKSITSVNSESIIYKKFDVSEKRNY